jgi:hypothetical protein
LSFPGRILSEPKLLFRKENGYGSFKDKMKQDMELKHLGAEIGFIGVLYTWSQTLIDHPHIHCIVTGGGLSFDGQKWVSNRPDFFIPVKVLSEVFRGKFLDYFKQAYESGKLRFDGQISLLKEMTKFKELLNGLYRLG